MKNPFRSEADAFRLVIGAVVYFGAIAIAAVAGGRWWGLGVFVVLSAAVAVGILRRDVREQRTVETRRRGAEDERRILVVANEPPPARRSARRCRRRSRGAERQCWSSARR